MPVIDIDTVNEMELEEERGVITSVTRNCLVQFAKQEMDAFRGNTSILRLALTALDDEGVRDGSQIGDPEDPNNPYNALYLIKRSPKLVADNQKVAVKLRYDHVLAGHNQVLSGTRIVDDEGNTTPPSFMSPDLTRIYGKGRCSIVDKTTNFYHPNGDDSKPREPIQVAYTYPPWETGLPATSMNPAYPRTILQGGEISIPFPQANNGFAGIVVTAKPYLLARRIIRYINSDPWCGEPALTWLCSEVSWEFNGWRQTDEGPFPTYKMGFEFQFNSDTWEPYVVFNDTRYGNAPANPPPYELKQAILLDGNLVMRLAFNPITLVEQPAGAWSVPALPRRDFDAFFGATIDGM